MARCASFALIAACTVAHAEPVGCLGKDPLASAKAFATRQENFYSVEPVNLHGKVEARLLAALSADYRCRESQVCAVVGDPWQAGLDGEIRKPGEFAVVSASPTRATVEMRYTLKNSAKRTPHSVRLQLTRGNPKACWLVADLLMPDGASLVGRIEDWHNQNAPGVYLPLP